MHDTLAYQNNHGTDPATGTNYAVKLAEAMKAAGNGQYYFAYDAMLGAGVEGQAYEFGFNILVKDTYKTKDDEGNSISATKLLVVNEVALSADKFTTASGYFNYEATYWVRTDLYLYGAKGAIDNVSMYIDNAQLVLLKTEIECAHEWNDGVADPDATCTEEGVITYTCTLCGETKTEAISVKDHTPAEAVKENEKAPTCVDAGSYESVVYCSVCNAELSRETMTGEPATGEHNYVDGACSVCGEAEPVTGPVKDETLVFYRNGLSFQEYIGLNFAVEKAKVEAYDTVYIKTWQEAFGEVDPVEETIYGELSGTRYVYNKKILAWSMTEQVTITLYAEKDGIVYEGETVVLSVESAAKALIEKGGVNVALAKAMMIYGDSAEAFLGK